MPTLGGWEWVILVLLIALLFGAKRLPDAARGLGRSLRIFKSETKGLVNETKAEATAAPTAPPAPPAVAAADPVTSEAPASAPERTES